MTEFDTCPHCGRQLLKGAMRCVGCGKILKTAEQQMDSIQRLRETKKGFDFGWIIRLVVIIIVAGVVYYYFGDQIAEMIDRYTGSRP